MKSEPHAFVGRHDRWCEVCNRADRDPIHVVADRADTGAREAQRHRTAVHVAPERQDGKRLTDRFQYRAHCLCGWVGPTLPTAGEAQVSGREHRSAASLTPLYWCPHWRSLSLNKCETCQSENGAQTAYYRASEVDAALAAGVGVPPDKDLVGAPAKERQDARRHVLNCWPKFFDAVADGTKPFEVRRDDRDPPFSVGDTLVLREWEPQRGVGFTGRTCERKVTYVLAGGQFGLEPGYVVMGLARAARFPNPSAGVGEARPAEPPQTYPANDLPAFGTQLRFAKETIKDWVSAPAEEQPDARAKHEKFLADREAWNARIEESLEPLNELAGREPGQAQTDEKSVPLPEAYDALEAECVRLREQLDAARQVAERYERYDVWQGLAAENTRLESSVSALTEQLDAAHRETGEYRRMWEETLHQLDAQAQVVEAAAAYVGAPDNGYEVASCYEALRAALGVVAAAETSGSALDQRAVETRGGETA